MAGHSQFKNIMHRKGAQDAKRSRLFSKLSREITIAAKIGAADPNMNPRLRLAIQDARANNMPKSNIERAIKRSQASDEADYQEVRYEGFGPAGIGVIVEALTDNKNRTAGEVRSIFAKNGGNLGETGSVSFMFDRVGQIVYPRDAASDEAMFEAAIVAGAEDCQSAADVHELYCAATDLNDVNAALSEKFGDPQSAKIGWRPQHVVPVAGADAGPRLALLEALDENDDVQNVYANFELEDAELQRLTA